MKVKRQDQSESYNITVDWINDFSRSITKESNFIDTLKNRFSNPDRKWSSIDEKMADIKKRVGFDKIESSNLRKNSHDENSSSGCSSQVDGGEECSSCSTGNECPCSDNGDFSEDELKKMNVILKYILDMVKSEPHLDEHSVVSKCRNEDGLGFDNLPIDMDVLKGYISELRNKYSKKEEPLVQYQLWEPSQDEFRDDYEADYSAHAYTGGRL